MRNPTARVAAAVLVVSAALPAVAAMLRPARAEGCARDGVALDGLFAVRIERGEGAAATFCSVRCADAWLRTAADGAPRPVVAVRDEVSRAWLPLDAAVLVRSTIVASKATGERIHAFESLPAAEAHVKAYGGVVLSGADRPLAVAR